MDSSPPLKAPRGVTALAGQMLRLNGEPLAQATLTIGIRSARTDATGCSPDRHRQRGSRCSSWMARRPIARPELRDLRVLHRHRGPRDHGPAVHDLDAALDTRNATVIPVPTPWARSWRPPRRSRVSRCASRQCDSPDFRRTADHDAAHTYSVDRPPFPLPAGATSRSRRKLMARSSSGPMARRIRPVCASSCPIWTGSGRYARGAAEL